MDENKSKALNAALSQIEKQFGKNTVMRLGDNTVQADIGKDIKDKIVETIREAYEPFKGNGDFIREVIIEQYQMKLMKKVFTENVLDLKKGDSDVIKKVFLEVQKIKKLGEHDDEEQNKGRFALAEFKKGERSVIDATPTYLKSLNKMTATRGFYSPQFIILMGPPKSFKTGLALNLATNLVRDGERVYYVDCENGEDRILDRFYQCMMEATWEEYNSGDIDDMLEEMVERFKALGGDFRSDFYPAHQKSTQDVEEALEKLKLEHGWTPSVIVWDYADLMKPEDYTIKEKRLKIQAVYHDIIRLHKRWGIWGISPSQVNKDAVNKTVIDMTAFAEDFGKAANAHAAFAICGTEDERKAHVRRIVPVMQRDGVDQSSNDCCFVRMDAARMSIKEIKHSEWKEAVDAVIKLKPSKPAKATSNPRGKTPVKDE